MVKKWTEIQIKKFYKLINFVFYKPYNLGYVVNKINDDVALSNKFMRQETTKSKN